MNKKYFDDLEQDIIRAYEEGNSLEDSERLAAKFLAAQLKVSDVLKVKDLDRRMRKRGLKALKSAVRLEECKRFDKKPAEGYLEDIVSSNKMVSDEEAAFDIAEVDTEELERLFGVYHEAHLYFRNIAKGRFE